MDESIAMKTMAKKVPFGLATFTKTKVLETTKTSLSEWFQKLNEDYCICVFCLCKIQISSICNEHSICQ